MLMPPTQMPNAQRERDNSETDKYRSDRKSIFEAIELHLLRFRRDRLNEANFQMLNSFC